MADGRFSREQTLASLDDVVRDAVNYFSGVDASLSDGYQTAHEVLVDDQYRTTS